MPTRLPIPWRFVIASVLLSLGTRVPVIAAVEPVGIAAQAVPGAPFGYGIVTIPLPASSSDAYLANGIQIDEENHRVFYPVVTANRPTRILDGFRQGESIPDTVSILFLFRGNQPLRLTVSIPQTVRLTVQPAPAGGLQTARLWSRWWTEYVSATQSRITNGDYPPLIESYLSSMLARRLNAPPVDRRATATTSELERIVSLLTGGERARISTMDEVMRLDNAAWAASSLPMPQPIRWRPTNLPEPPPNVPMEEIAQHVPENCFYIRFGNFTNFLWLDRLTKEYGGDLARMVTQRGHRNDVGARMQQRLGVEQNALAEALGDQVVADQAVIGRDMFLADGAAVGVIIQAKNALLSFGMNQQRSAILEKEKANGATLRNVMIAGREVSLLSTPDNRLRSFYVTDGDFHLLTTCEKIAEGFLEAGAGRGSLARSKPFLWARAAMPLSREDTIFAFLSPAFLQGLLSAEYQAEVQRRRRSLAEIELLDLARRVAAHERLPHDSLDALIAAGLLPRGFASRSDGSGLAFRQGEIVDTLRGARGAFLPVPDCPVTSVSAMELDSFTRHAQFFHEKWQEMDPVMVGIKRYALEEGNRERLVLEASVAPLVEKKYGKWIAIIGQPVSERVRPLPGDAIWIQAALNGGLFDSPAAPHHFFLGVQDASPLSSTSAVSFFDKFRIAATTPAYFGTWPQTGWLDRLPFGLAGQADAAGYSRFPLGLWRRQINGFSVLSLDPRLLGEVTPQLRPEPTDNPAQIRIHVGDLAQTKLAAQINAETFQRVFRASLGNAKFLHELSQQLGTPPDAAMRDAERILGVELVCPLGGEYGLTHREGEASIWRSNRWPALASPRMPDDFQAPFLNWFRGLDADVTKTGDRILVKAQLDLERHPKEPKIDLPLFNWLGGNKKAPAGKAPQAKKGREF